MRSFPDELSVTPVAQRYSSATACHLDSAWDSERVLETRTGLSDILHMTLMGVSLRTESSRVIVGLANRPSAECRSAVA